MPGDTEKTESVLKGIRVLTDIPICYVFLSVDVKKISRKSISFTLFEQALLFLPLSKIFPGKFMFLQSTTCRTGGGQRHGQL